MFRSFRPLLLALPLAAGGCGADSPTSELATIETTTFGAGLGVNLAASTKTNSGLYYRDLSVGSGTVVASGQTVQVRYTLWLANGSQLESNVGSGAPYSFRVGAGQVIAGWDEGVPGMRVGGSRQLIIPPALGYGTSGSGPVPGNAILVFSVQVVSAQ